MAIVVTGYMIARELAQQLVADARTCAGCGPDRVRSLLSIVRSDSPTDTSGVRVVH